MALLPLLSQMIAKQVQLPDVSDAKQPEKLSRQTKVDCLLADL